MSGTEVGRAGSGDWAEWLRDRLLAPIGAVFAGSPETVEQTVICVLAGGHVLIEGLPGSGKTTLAQALARAMAGTCRRIQFTPDLLPGEVTGGAVPDGVSGRLRFQKGPIFANVVVADEINRASPKTQSALLEAMEERQVTVDGKTRPLPEPFLLAATQNPVELQGTYPLPEAQLDRFLMRVVVDTPDEATECAIAQGRFGRAADVTPRMTPGELTAALRAFGTVPAPTPLTAYAVRLARATRGHPDTSRGVSVRATAALVRAARARAMLDGRRYPVADDVQALAVPVLAHRMVVRPGAGREAADVVAELVRRVRVPERTAVR